VRGIAVLAAAGAVWVLVTGKLPTVPGRSVVRPTAGTLAAAAACGIAVTLLALGLTGVPAAAVALGSMGAVVPVAAATVRATREHEAIADAWPDFIALIRSNLASGASLPEAFGAAGRESGDRLAAAADRVTEATRRGAGFVAVLSDLQADFADPLADRVFASLAAAHRTGGSRVGVVLGALGTSIADELRLRKAHRAALTQQRLTAAVALVAPWALLMLTLATNPQAADVYRTASGVRVIVAGLLATGGGFLLARRAARLSRPPRVLR
jgi:Flp pilus assembly protein TadB